MRVKRTKNKVTYSFTGELQNELETAKKELNKKIQSQERTFLQWQLKKAQKAYNNYEKRIEDLQTFIRLAEKKIAEKEEERHEDGQ